MRQRALGLVGMGLWLWGVAAGASNPSIDAILRRATDPFKGIEDYSARMEIRLTGENLRMPPSSGTLYYKQPNKVKVTSEKRQFVLLPKQGIVTGDWVSQLRANADTALEGERALRGRSHYVLRFIPKEAQENMAYARAWLDRDTYTLSRLELVAADESRLQVEVWNQQVRGRCWLPSRLEISFRFRNQRLGPPHEDRQIADMLKDARATLLFHDYRINQGLSDALFEDADSS